MKKNKVVILQDKNFIEIEKALAVRGYFDYEIKKCCDFDEFISNADADDMIFLCKNDLIDEAVEKLKSGDSILSLLDSQAVLVTDGEKRKLFIPIELDYNKFLDEFLEKKPVYICQIFGKSLQSVSNKFDEFQTSYKIITKSQLLHTVYYDTYIDQQNLLDAFSNAVFAFDETSLEGACKTQLNDKKFALLEQVSCGNILAKLSSVGEFKNAKILLNDEDFIAAGVSQEMLTQFGTQSKEIAVELVKNSLAESDIALSVVGFDCDSGKIFVAVGNKSQIHVFSTEFAGDKVLRLENTSNFALFELLRFLKEKCWNHFEKLDK